MSNWLKLRNKTAIITGAGSGIGRAIAKALHSQKCNLFLADANEKSLEDLLSTFKEESPTSTSMHTISCVDVTSKEQVHDLIQYVDSVTNEQHFNNASILINAAGITRDSLIHYVCEESYDQVLDTNLKGTFLTCQAFCAPDRVERLCKSGHGGSIVNIGSVISERGNIGQTNYAASKGGVVGLTRALAKEMAYLSNKFKDEHGIGAGAGAGAGSTEEGTYRYGDIRVNAILPGFIQTPMTAAVPEHNKKRIVSQIPLNRFGKPEDVANMALFLSSQERSGYVTGECWECSGAIAI
jgi:NAD(P)-dependent dehydrogenase (short-subunit alcohol dehydrogenase family)